MDNTTTETKIYYRGFREGREDFKEKVRQFAQKRYNDSREIMDGFKQEAWKQVLEQIEAL